MRQYLDLLKDVLDNGTYRHDRTGTGVRSKFGTQLRFDLNKGFPIITTKKIHMKSVIYELLWEISGNTNVKYLQDHGVRIWNEWADDNGDLGPVYGAQWRNFNGQHIDQLKNAVDMIKNNPTSRRIIVSTWNPVVLPDENEKDFNKNISEGKMSLAPCHCFYQFYVSDNKLSCQVYQRSVDCFLGMPFDISSYSLLTMMIAQVCGLEPGELIYIFGDTHIYRNHIEQVKEQLTRTPKELPRMIINPDVKDLFDFKYEDFTLEGYDPYPPTKAQISV
jgi:thymidylate synthase